MCTVCNYACSAPTKSDYCENILIACSFLNINLSALGEEVAEVFHEEL